ncbi:hypothetical protein [Caballeronia sp. LZ034LL]|uniref:hypothetical protein n=1 Tax=Caballeronia sp. LZ034LL TaxID=3038567 RepID=UPI0028661471|nr:hypothetical protein [Caballeronia sp. LZ034LL]MDR5838051.1 hypothetical protein [Caballeronia sp. LZ034LL]
MRRVLFRVTLALIFIGLTYRAGIWLAVFIIRQTPEMPDWLDDTIRFGIELTHSDVSDPEDISTIANLATFVASWIVVGVMLSAAYVLACRFWRRRRQRKGATTS